MSERGAWSSLSKVVLVVTPTLWGCTITLPDPDDYYGDDYDEYTDGDGSVSSGGTDAASGGAPTTSGGESSGGSSAAGGSSSSGGSNGANGGTSSSSCTSPSVPGTTIVQVRDEEGQGEISQSNVCVPALGLIQKITLRYNMDSFFGEPTRAAVFAYHADFGVAMGNWVARVVSPTGEPVVASGGPVFASWEEGAWPDPGGEFGFDATGSPSWSQTFVYYSGGEAIAGYVDAAVAKEIYQAGFSLDGLKMLSVNDKPVLY